MTYEPPCRDEHAKIDFLAKPAEVFNLIRGCDPQPGAFANLGEKRVRLYEAGYWRASRMRRRELIVAIDAEGMKIALADATLTIKRARESIRILRKSRRLSWLRREKSASARS